MRFSSCALPELGRVSKTNVNKLTNFEYASLFSILYRVTMVVKDLSWVDLDL